MRKLFAKSPSNNIVIDESTDETSSTITVRNFSSPESEQTKYYRKSFEQNNLAIDRDYFERAFDKAMKGSLINGKFEFFDVNDEIYIEVKGSKEGESKLYPLSIYLYNNCNFDDKYCIIHKGELGTEQIISEFDVVEKMLEEYKNIFDKDYFESASFDIGEKTVNIMFASGSRIFFSVHSKDGSIERIISDYCAFAKELENISGVSDKEVCSSEGAPTPSGEWKNDRLDNKLRWDLLPILEIEDIVKVFHYGAQKYAPGSWKEVPDGFMRYYAASMRHIVEYFKGNRYDGESGLHHLAQAAWNLIAMLHYDKAGKGFIIPEIIKNRDSN